MIKDSFHTMSEESVGEFKDRGSKFIGYVFPCYSLVQFEERLLEIKKDHPKARHWCYAYRLGLHGESYRANDDGEPSGSAGLPILGQLKSNELVNVAAIVVRYWGGTKLGVSGLINAYKSGALLAIANGKIIKEIVSSTYRLCFDYTQMGQLMNTVKQMDLNITNKQFEEQPWIEIQIRQSEEESQLNLFKAKFLDISLEELLSKDVDCGIEIIKQDD